MKNILGIFYAKSESDVTLEDEDWKSAVNAIDIHLKRKGWEVNQDHYKCDNCEVQSHTFEKPTSDDDSEQNPYEIVIKGNCSSDFDYKGIIEDILQVLKNRYILLVGKVFIGSDDPTSTALVLVCSDSEESTVRVLRNSFETF